MNDILNPTGLDLTKNLHGHVRVETRSRWTGKVIDSQEKDNLITNAINRLVTSSVWSQNQQVIPNYWFPIYQRALGGIMLFDNTLTESASNIAFPSSAKLVAFAGQGANGTSPTGGTYNAVESTPIANGYTGVWDFSTSQANGTIASISRTSSYVSSYPIYYTTVTLQYAAGRSSNNTLTNYSILGYDEVNEVMYITPVSNSTIDGTQYSTNTIYRAKAPIYKLDLYGGMRPASDMTVIKTLTSSDGTGSARYFIYDKYLNNFVYLSANTLHFIAMDGTHTSQTVSGLSGSLAAVTENYYWTLLGSTVYRVSKSNTSNVTTYNMPGLCVLCPSKGDVIFAAPSSSNNWFCIIYPDGTVLQSTVNANFSQNSSDKLGHYTDLWISLNYNASGSTPYVCPHYLGTIANLDSPVTKTSSQTMKITYTLTES